MTEEDLRWLRSEFERCTPWLQAAIDRDIAGSFTLEDVWDYVASDRAQFWPFQKSAVVTTLEYFPRKIMLRYWLCGGDLKDCLQHEDVVETWAKQAGAAGTLIGGRRGWLRALTGYKEAYTIMVKDF